MAAGKPVQNASATHTSGSLTIGHRVLTTPSRTITIANISTISVGTDTEHRPRGLFTILAFGGIGALALFAMSRLGLLTVAIDPGVAIVGAVTGLIFGVLAAKPDDKTHYLLISSNDGLLTRFSAQDRSMLDEVRALLNQKIDTGDETVTYAINFTDGQIEGISSGQEPSRAGSAQANGRANSAGLQPPSEAPNRGSIGGFGDRNRSSAAVDGFANAGRPPAATHAGVNGQSAQTLAVAESYVDFRSHLPAVVEMHRFYARQANTEHLEQRLSELELLMRSGAQTYGQKQRVRELTHDLGHILQAYPPAVQIFQQISVLAAS